MARVRTAASQPAGPGQLSEKSTTRETSLAKRIKKIIKSHWWIAAVLALLCFAGAWLVWWHWEGQEWSVRAAELGGPGQFRHLSREQTGKLLEEAADRWRPSLGLLFLAAGGLLGSAVSAGPLARRMMRAAGWTLVGLIGVHLIEDQLLAATVHAAPAGHHLNAYALWLQGAAFLSEALLPIAGMVAVLGGMTALARLVTWLARPFLAWFEARLAIALLAISPKEENAPDSAPARAASRLMTKSVARVFSWNNKTDPLRSVLLEDDGDRANWRHNSSLPLARASENGAGDQRRMGICLSGGGVRSASFGLGALQALQRQDALTPIAGHKGEKHSELARAKYLTAVSGGSYIAGAFLLAVLEKEGSAARERSWRRAWQRFTNLVKGDAPDGTPGKEAPAEGKKASLDFDHVFRPGSHEFDHLRRHSSYIADGFKEWVAAIFIVLRGAFVSTMILGLVALVAGRWVGYLYNQIGRQADLGSPWHPIWGPVFATVGVIALGLLSWAASTVLTLPPKAGAILMEIAKMAGVAAGVLAVLGAAIPITAWASMSIIGHTGGTGTSVGGFAVGAFKGGTLGLIGIITTTLGLLSRQRAQLLKTVRSAATTWRERLGDVGRRAVQWLCVYTGLAIVAAVYLIVFGYSTSVIAAADPDEHPLIRWGIPWWQFPLSNYQVTLVLTGLLIVLYLLVDETALGLHPFYRSRLASAFAVRRVRAGKGAEGDPPQPEPGAEFEAEPYPWEEITTLEAYGNPRQGAGMPPFPHVIFCASAHCSDADDTPPGRHVLPFTFSYDAVGGPEIGWCRPAELRKRGSRRLGADLTVETAMAVSGAAFASATGSYQSAANVVLALANARLGTWVVNPGQVTTASGEWWPPRPPRIRRLSYLLREIFGWYPKELPLVFVTDGGLYENLGLLELFRHRCTEIYCFDASSDAETFAASLAQSITLAANELGVTVEPDRPEQADPRAGGKDVEAGDLQKRLAETPVITASVTYASRAPEGEGERGVLVIGRATLDADTPWEIRRHAAAHPLFPNDATGDQWFDDCKFNAYTALGRHVGQHAIAAMLVERSRLGCHG